MKRVAGDEALSLKLRQAGIERAAQFSWERAARATTSCYRRVLNTAPTMD
jgi:hypothetical protein